MSEKRFELRFFGVRGSTPASVGRAIRYGAHTTCLGIELGYDDHLLIDAGTGMSEAALEYHTKLIDQESPRFDILLTHYHWDHIAGLPFFDPLYEADCTLNFHGPAVAGKGPREILAEAIRPPYFPVPFAETPSAKTFRELDGRPFKVGPFSVRSAPLKHPQGSVAYRLDHPGGSLVFATDVEAGEPNSDAALRDLARGTDVLIHDAQIMPEEGDCYEGQGHSTWRDAVAVAEDCGAKRLVLFHHAPYRMEHYLDSMLEAAREAFPDTEAAREGGSVEF